MTQEATKHKLAAILSADLKEYSRLMSRDERGTIRTVRAYKEAMSSLIEEYEGRVVDAPGDKLSADHPARSTLKGCNGYPDPPWLCESYFSSSKPPDRRCSDRIGADGHSSPRFGWQPEISVKISL